MLFSTAFAQTTTGGGSDFQAQLVQFAPLIMIAAVFYFLLIRPQQQRAKQPHPSPRNYLPISSRYFSASSAAMQPVPAAVIACR